MNRTHNLADFSQESIYVGIDVHKNSWHVTTRYNKMTVGSTSQSPEPAALLTYLKRRYPSADYHCVYEAGFSGFWIQRELQRLGANCIVVHAADVPTGDKERRGKTDAVDSAKLALHLEAGLLRPINIPTADLEADRDLMRLRSTVIKDRTRTKNRIKQHLVRYGLTWPNTSSSWTKEHMSWLRQVRLPNPMAKKVLDILLGNLDYHNEQLKEITKTITELSCTEKYARNFKLLTSTPGVGLITAMTFLTEIGEVRRFPNLDKLCSFVGFIPNTHSSGEKLRVGNMTRRGNSFLKKAIIEASWIIIRKDPAMARAYKQYCQRMKKTKAIVKIARKLLSRMRTLLIKQTTYHQGIA